MEALTSTLSTKIFTRNSNTTLSVSSTLTVLGRSDFGFSRSSTFKRLQFHDLVLSRTIAKSHVAYDSAEVSVGFENAVAEIPSIKTSKRIHVKFQLQKQCMFGDQFLLVGDDPMLGLWNPADAIPMNWSDEHIWSTELDVPIESTIQFKFILKQCSGEIFWQPGPDRIFKSWESNGTIIISEDWENSEAQKIMEEKMESVINHDLTPTDAENITNQSEGLLANMNNDIMFSGNVAFAEEKLIDDNELFTRGSSTLKQELPKKTLFSYEEGNVLVPGITPLQAASTNEFGSITANSSFGVADAPFGVDLAKE
ncbi:cyclomaltodextrin glucanotransferase [Ricinus communis]|uniref:cyclomaltodextrin glucanotransferase n=1 Tax=Ricinus communis TaxID=3988 RepID=UPI00077220A0|nr:cyclomaltodextrin glucanotransferase [Ricinus communis]|eukprot:XP_015578775.1 uncharacterized protein LOC8286439 [Ricinus communis]